ncbi:tail fiber domain-containing protein [Roseibium algae]|uniref:Tail fiber domain-containing protein n=1 Tax=Roseibium algae TaxID=3123038 RepID=A0ABU8TL41_9HYPH
MQDTKTPRGYPIPDPANDISVDFPRIASALGLVDNDIANLLSSVSQRALSDHQHLISEIEGLSDVLANLANSSGNHTHALGDLSDVDVTSAQTNMVLAFIGGVWTAAVMNAANLAVSQGGGITANNVQDALVHLHSSKATQADIDNTLAGVIGAAPTTLDTLNELAAALGDDPNFATTVASQIAAVSASASAKLARTGGTLTGNVRFNDNVKANFGNSDDFRVFHNGSHAYLDNYTGNIYLRNRVHAAEFHFQGEDSGGTLRTIVTLQDGYYLRAYCSGVERLRTTTAGVTVYGDMNSTSDKRLKEDFQPIENALDKLLQLNGLTFMRKGHDKRSIGLIAQEVEAQFPEAVSEDQDGNKLLAIANLMGPVVEAIRELNEVIEAQGAEIKALQAAN